MWRSRKWRFGGERRKRVVKSFPARIGGLRGEHSALCVDFSEGGLGLVVESLTIPRPNQEVDVTVDTTNGRLMARGVVVHAGRTRPDKIGVRFVSRLDADSRRALQHVLGG